MSSLPASSVWLTPSRRRRARTLEPSLRLLMAPPRAMLQPFTAFHCADCKSQQPNLLHRLILLILAHALLIIYNDDERHSRTGFRDPRRGAPRVAAHPH